MAKLTFNSAKAALGIGTFVEKTIKFRDKDSNEFSGEILVKILAHDDLVSATDVWNMKDKQELTIDHLRKALIFQTVYEDEQHKFFPAITDTGSVSTELIDAMYKAADEVIDFSGKNWISVTAKNSGANLSAVESAEEPSPTPNET